jgi:hypothetical protein
VTRLEHAASRRPLAKRAPFPILSASHNQEKD